MHIKSNHQSTFVSSINILKVQYARGEADPEAFSVPNDFAFQSCKSNSGLDYGKCDGKITQKLIIFDNDMGTDDAWALQMLLKAEKVYKTVKILAITIVDGNTSVKNATKGVGNITPYAEFNFYVDPEAAFIILHSIKCSITIFPWEAGFLNISLDWRFDVLGAPDGENIQLYNQADRVTFRNLPDFQPYDAFLTASILFPEKVIKKKGRQNATVELNESLTRGQMLLDRQSDRKNIILTEQLNVEEFKQALLFTATR